MGFSGVTKPNRRRDQGGYRLQLRLTNIDLELTQTQTELTAWRLANGKAHLPKPLKEKIVALNRRFSTVELSRAVGIPLATLSYWKRQAATPEVKRDMLESGV